MASSTTLPPTTKTASIATAFTRKLYRMLDIEDPAVIGWDVSGLSFSIRDEEQLDENVLPRYYRGRVDVFRQHLSEHGFQRTLVTGGSRQIETFTHQHFIRGEPNRLSQIVRVPTNKRRRSRMGKKRSAPGPAAPLSQKREEVATATPSFVDDDGFDLDKFLHESTTMTPHAAPGVQQQNSGSSDDLHESLARILALHATNPVVASKAMLDSEPGNLTKSPQIDTPLFSFDMMASMVEWLDTSA